MEKGLISFLIEEELIVSTSMAVTCVGVLFVLLRVFS